MNNNPDSYEVITEEDPETGDIIVPIPPAILKQMGWNEGDTIEFTKDDQGRYVLTKTNV